MKTKKILIYVIVIIITIAVSYFWGMHCNLVYRGGANTFFLRDRLADFMDTIWIASLEELTWRFVPLLVISCILFFLKYDSNKIKKYILCCFSFIIIAFIQVKFGLIHYNHIHETQDWVIKHIVIQGVTGLFFAIAYNIIQHYTRNRQKSNLIVSHLIALLLTTVIHIITDMSLIVSQTR